MTEYDDNPRRDRTSADPEPYATTELPRAEPERPTQVDEPGRWSPASAGAPAPAGPYPPPGPWRPAGPQPQSPAGWAGARPPAQVSGQPLGPDLRFGPGQPPGPGQFGQSATVGPGQSYDPGAPVGPGQPYDPGHPPGWPSAQPAPAPGARPGRVGRVLVLGVAALVLAVGSSVLGGWAALQMNSDGTQPVAERNGPAAPVVDRSSLAGIAAAVKKSVVSISTGTGEGSGVVMSGDGLVLTNNHVVAGAQQVSVTFTDGKSARARVVGTDARTDLAVVKAEGVSNLTPARIGDSSAMQVGDTVLALGSPLGLEGSVTAGIISAENRTIRTGEESPGGAGASMSGLLQTDAPINPGNSGGALVNTRSEVIGINTAIATSGQGQGNIGVGFAIPSNKAKQVYDQLVKGEKVTHPFLGVNVSDGENGGAVVGTVQENSPAAKAGIRQGDVILKLGDRQINGSDDLVSAVQAGKAGQKLQVTFVRNGSQETATVTLGEAS